MADAAEDRRRALYEAYLAVPPTQRAEIIRGTLYVMSRPAPRHANAASSLGGELHGPFQRGRGGPGGWWILFEPEIRVIELEPFAPDLAGWRLERMPELPETAYFAIVPDWICEVLSKSTERIDRHEKLPMYAELGVPHVWIVDPIAQILEVHSLPDATRYTNVRIHEGDRRARATPFDAIELELAALWGRPTPPK